MFDAAQIIEIAQRVAPATSTDRAYPALAHVLVEAGPGPEVTVAATDRFRLAVLTLHAQARTARCAPAALIPARLIARAARVLRPADAVALGWNDRHASLATERASITTRLGAGEFPDYRSLLPTPARELLLPRDSLRRAVAHVRGLLDPRCPVTLGFCRSTVTVADAYGDQASIKRGRGTGDPDHRGPAARVQPGLPG